MKTDTPAQLSTLTIALHWIVGLSIIGLLAVGVYMNETETYSLYPLHKSFGFLIFFVVLARVAWRIKNGWPTPVGQHKVIEQRLARVVHYVLLIGTVLMPISGMMMSVLGGHGLDLFGLEIVARNIDPANPQKALPINESLAGLGHETHEVLGTVMIVAVLLHIAGGVKHHVIDKDGTLRRMLGAKV